MSFRRTFYQRVGRSENRDKCQRWTACEVLGFGKGGIGLALRVYF